MSFIIDKPNGVSIDLTDYVVAGSLTLGARCDEAFAKGNCQLIMTNKVKIDGEITTSTEFYYNIPPFTLAYIDGKKFFIHSTVTRFETQTQQATYVHDVDIIEPLAVLECYLVGTKAFQGNRLTDLEKINVLCELMSNKYGVVLSVEDMPTRIESQKYEYFFANGTTLYDAIAQICIRNNLRPIIKTINYQSSVLNIVISAIDLTSPTAMVVLENDIITRTQTQDQDNYCKFLETETNNVIDRDNLTYDFKVSLRGPEGEKLTATDNGNAKLYTTNKINRINKFEANKKAQVSFVLSGVDFFFNSMQVDQNHNIFYNPSPSGEILTLYEWCLNTARESESVTQCQLYLLALDICNQMGADIEKLLQIEYKCLVTTHQYTFEKDGIEYTDWTFTLETVDNDNATVETAPIDLTTHIREKKKYDALPDAYKTLFCYYTQGTNVIDGLYYVIGNDLWTDFWQFVAGANKGPFVNYIPNYDSSPSVYYANIVGWYSGHDSQAGATTSVNKELYNIEYEAIVDPMMLDVKTDTPINESSYKSIARSYGISASQIDFDKMVDSMSFMNGTLGKPEWTIEYKVAFDTPISSLNLRLGARLYISGLPYGYVLNYEVRYGVSSKSVVLFTTQSVQNIAKAIGVPYQYHETRLPVEGIIERPIRSEITLSSSEKNLLDNAITSKRGIYVYFTFTAATGSNTYKVVKRVSYMKRNNKRILYCEADDNLSMGTRLQPAVTAIGDIVYPVQYSDSNNEATNMSFKIGVLNITANQSADMPRALKFNESDFTITGVTNQAIFKDAYEKLTFTIEIK